MLREQLKKPYIQVLILIPLQMFVILSVWNLLAVREYLIAGIVALTFQAAMNTLLERYIPDLYTLWKRRWGWIFFSSLLIVTLQAMHAVHEPSSIFVRHAWLKDLPLGLLSLCFFHLGAHSVRDAEKLN